MNEHDYLESLLEQMESQELSDAFLHQDEVPSVRQQGSVISSEHSPCPQAVFDLIAEKCSIQREPGQSYDCGLSSQTGARFRVNLYYQMGKSAAVLRRLNTFIPTLADLLLPAEMLQKWAARSSGLILISGPPGSGKSTTSASLLEWVNATEHKHVVCIEDPVEFLHLNQNCIFTHREVGQDIPSFARGMEEALRQSPDIILLGEVRDIDTARATLQAAETGHLVIATVHGASATEALERFVQIFHKPEQDSARLILSTALIGILFQRLLLSLQGQHIPALEYFENQGLIQRLIRENRTEELRDHLQKQDLPNQSSLISHLTHLAQDGWIDEETGKQILTNPQDFLRAMKGFR